MRWLAQARIARGVAVVDDLQDIEGRDLQIKVPAGRLVVGHPHRPRTEAGAGPVGRAAVPGGPDDRDVRPRLVELPRLRQRTDLHERGRTHVVRAAELRVEVGRLGHLPTLAPALQVFQNLARGVAAVDAADPATGMRAGAT